MSIVHRAALVAALAGGAAPAAAEELSAALTPIVNAERAFAKRGGEVGVRQSFLEYFAADAVSFTPEPGEARPRLEKRPPLTGPPPFLLEWGPEQAEVAPGGELGWTTGPSRVTDKAGKQPEHDGYYFSLWRKQADGGFKVVLDIGTDIPSAVPIPTEAVAVGASKKKAAKATATAADVERRDAEFCKAAASGAGKAYAAALAANARLNLDGAMPVVGEKAWRPWVKGLKGVMSCKATGGGGVPGLGYVYGSWERRDAAGGEVVEKGFYTRVWRQDGPLQIAADVRTVVK